MNKKDFVTTLGQLRPNSTFLSIIGYSNEYSEIADYSILFHVSYENMLKRSIIKLNDISSKDPLILQAKKELLKSFNSSLEKYKDVPEEETNDETYARFFNKDGTCIKGIKTHTKTNVLHLYGFVQHKRVIMPGIYPVTNQKELTKAKNNLRKQLPISKFRQFKMLPNQLSHISVENIKLIPPKK